MPDAPDIPQPQGQPMQSMQADISCPSCGHTFQPAAAMIKDTSAPLQRASLSMPSPEKRAAYVGKSQPGQASSTQKAMPGVMP